MNNLLKTLITIPIFIASLFAHEPDITVSGDLLSINGQTEVPRGLFGTHNVPLTPERLESWGIEADRSIDQNPSGAVRESKTPILIECLFDRYQPALMLNDPNWKDRLKRIATRYGKEARELDREPLLEFWNEPYLNWAVKPGVNYDGGLYQGPPEPGEPMRTKIGGDLIENLVWDKPRPVAIRDFKPGKDNIDYLATRFMSKELVAGDSFEWRNKPYRVEDRWWGKDTAQAASWWSGPVNREYYHRMFEVYARALEAANPDVTLIAGWGFHLNETNWAAWHTLHKPLIDFGIEWIDGYNEHHYGGNTRMVAGTYETAWAYTQGNHGKRMKFFNTEAGGMLDPERPGSFSSAIEGDPVTKGRGAYTYMVRDILHLIDTGPDKAITRVAHNSHGTAGGDESAFKLMRTLRGSLIDVDDHKDPNIWTVASLDGLNYTVIVFNDHYQPKEIDLLIKAPVGFSLDGGTIAQAVNVEGVGVRLKEEELAYSKHNSLYKHSVQLEGKDAVRYHFQLKQEAPVEQRELAITQFPAPEILLEAKPSEPATFSIKLPRNERQNADSARLRFVHDSNLRWRSEDLQITLNDQILEGRVATDYIVEFAIPLEALQLENSVRFHISPEGKAALICMASIMLDEYK